MSYHGHGMGLTMNATLLQQPAPTTQQSLLTQQSKMLLAVSSPTATLISPTTAVTTVAAPSIPTYPTRLTREQVQSIVAGTSSCPSGTALYIEWRRRDGTLHPMFRPYQNGSPGDAWDDVAGYCMSTRTADTLNVAPQAPPPNIASMVLRAAPTATHEPAGTPPVDETVLVDSEIVAPEELAQSFVEEQVPASWIQQPPVSQPLVANGERKIPWLWIGLGVAGLAGAAWWMMRKK